MQNCFLDYDTLLEERAALFQEVKGQYKTFKKNAEPTIQRIAYGKESKYLGHFCPSLILDKTTKGFCRDKLQKSLRKRATAYVAYEMDRSDQLVRIQEVDSAGSVFETYLHSVGDSVVSLTFLDGKPVSSNENVRYKPGKHGVELFYIMGSSHLWEEKYDYSQIARNRIHCTKTYYVPNLVNSDKSIAAGNTGSPARRYEIEIHLNPAGEIERVEHTEILYGERLVPSVWGKIS